MGFALSPIRLSSTTFADSGAIPKRYTREGDDVSPQLSWSNVPVEAKSYAIICHDPDAPLVSPGTYGYVHWVLYNLPANIQSLDENTDLGTQGKNDFGEPGYGGPMPPEGHGDHHYYFMILALDTNLQLPSGLSMWEFLEKAEPHIIAMNRLIGKYRR